MADLVKSIFDKFTHLVRDLFFYFISGFIVVLYISYLFSFSKLIFSNSSHAIIVIILSFVLGHILMIFSNVCDIFKCKKITKVERKLLKKEIIIFMNHDHNSKRNDVYDQFIERYNTLYFFRRVLSVSFFFIFIISLCYLCFLTGDLLHGIESNNLNDFDNLLFSQNTEKFIVSLLTLLLSFLFSFILFFGAIKAKKDMSKRIEIIYKELQKNE